MSGNQAKKGELVRTDDIVDAEIVEETGGAEADPNPDRTAARELLRLRREASTAEGHIANHKLHAGSPMYYYCKYCGVHTDTKNEGWFLYPPITVCADCTSLIELGWHDGVMPAFPYSN